MDFSGKVILVTGGSRGIGRAIAQAYAKCGGCVAISYISHRKHAEETLKSMQGGPHHVIQADVSNANSVKHLIDSVISKFGRLDIVVNNAGISSFQPIDNIDFSEWNNIWHDTIEVNLIGPANVMYYATQYMIKNGGGRIVNVSSRAAFRGQPDAPAYVASKAGLNAMSQSLAQKLAKYNIYIYMVAPSFVETDMTAPLLKGSKGEKIKNESPLGRVARPEEVARVVLFLSSEGTEYLTGAIIDINGASYLRS